MSYISDVRSNQQQVEYQKFVEIQNDSRFPPISVIRSEYADSSTASVTSLSIYPKTAVLTYSVNNVSFPDTSITAFDELRVESLYPLIQIDAIYGLNNTQVFALSSGTGSYGIENTNMWSVSSGTTLGSLADIGSIRYVKYRPGQGVIARFTAMFLNSASNAFAVAGMRNAENAYYFGYSGLSNSFGIGHYYDGVCQSVVLTLTAAPNAGQTIDINLNGTHYPVTLTSSTTGVAAETIKRAFNNNAIWRADAIDGTVEFTAARALASYSTGNYSVSSTGNCSGTFVTVASGVNRTAVWTPVSAWNGTPVANFDPSKLNVYQINFRWLGAGVVRFGMEDASTGNMINVHTQLWSNKNTKPHISKPSMRLGYTTNVASGSLSVPSIVRGSSMMAAIEGNAKSTKLTQSIYALSNAGSRTTGSLWHLISLRNPWQQNYATNVQEILIEDLSVSISSQQGNNNRPIVITGYIDGSNITTSTVQTFSRIPGTYILANTDASLTVTANNLTPAFSLVTGSTASQQLDLTPFRLVLSPGQQLTIVASSDGTISDSSIALIWNPE